MNSQIESQINRIINNMKKRVDEVAAEELPRSMLHIINIGLVEMEGFANVTGNTRNSLAVALFHDGDFKGFYSSFDALNHRPTRVTLRKGEAYDLDFYWDGTPVDSLGSPYVAPTGERNYWAQEEAQDFLQDKIPTRKGWCYVIVAAVDYAKYLEARDGVNVLTRMHDEFESKGADVTDMMNG